MALAKNIFIKSKMNKDLDERLVGKGEYRDAQNINVSRSEGDDVGSVENVLGNELVTNLTTSTIYDNKQVIGQYIDQSKERGFFYITDHYDNSSDRLSNFAGKGSTHTIIMRDFTNNSTHTLVEGRFLNFSITHPILNIDLIEDLLFWTDNRNQPRKCWDHTIIAWVEFVEMHYKANIENCKDLITNEYTKRPVKLIVGTSIDAYWNLWDVLENEVKFRNVPLAYVKSTIVEVKTPQQLSDREINILYNSCDVGCNNCNGGGYELTVFECLGLGKPQVSSYVGGIREYLSKDNSIPIEPKFYYYLDNKSNGIGGKAELTDPHDFANGFWKYLSDPKLAKKHGENGRENILKNYRWETLVDYFYNKVLSNIIKN